MPSQYIVSQLVDVFRPIYRTIELRVALLRTGADWMLGAVAVLGMSADFWLGLQQDWIFGTRCGAGKRERLPGSSHFAA